MSALLFRGKCDNHQGSLRPLYEPIYDTTNRRFVERLVEPWVIHHILGAYTHNERPGLSRPWLIEDVSIRKICRMETVLRDFSATCEASVSRPLAEELCCTIISGNPDVNIVRWKVTSMSATDGECSTSGEAHRGSTSLEEEQERQGSGVSKLNRHSAIQIPKCYVPSGGPSTQATGKRGPRSGRAACVWRSLVCPRRESNTRPAV